MTAQLSRLSRVILPTHSEVHRSVSCPEVLSSWRSRTLSEAEILAEVRREAKLRHDFVEIVLTPGHLLRTDAESIWGSLRSHFPQIKIRQLLHWTQALSLKRQGERWRSAFPEVQFEIAVDASLSRATMDLLFQAWQPDWLIIPRPDWSQNEKSGDLALKSFVEIERRRSDRSTQQPIELMVFSPRPDHPDGPFLDNDELQLYLDEARDLYPDVRFVPPPPSYFVASELGTWNRELSRDAWPDLTDDRTESNSVPQEIELSIICPVKSLNFPEALKRLRILRENAGFSTELIIVRDDGGSLTPHGDEIWLAMPSRSLDLTSTEEWRAGAVRNLGARAAQGRHLLFVDADVRLPLDAFSELASSWRHQARVNVAHKAGAWWSASSSCWILPREEFWAVGGFAEAFSTYGCEDADLAFRLQAAGFSTDPLPFLITHLRPESNDDYGLAKMLKLQVAAQLLHRLTLSAETHFVFYSVMGSRQQSSAALRALGKRLWDLPLLGAWLSLQTEFMTLIESKEKLQFVRGWLTRFLWIFKGPALLLFSERWRVQIIGHVAHRHAWKLPHAIAWPLHQARRLWGAMAGPLSRIRIAFVSSVQSKSWLIPHFVKWPLYLLGRGLEKISGPLHALTLKARYSQFGLKPLFGWIWSQRHWPSVWILRIRGATHKWATRVRWIAVNTAKSLVNGLHQVGWKMRVGTQRGLGSTRAFAWQFVLHPIWETIGRIYARIGEDFYGPTATWLGHKVYAPTSAWFCDKIYGPTYAWTCEALIGPLQANLWLLREPTAWFELKCPSFHRLIWKRLLKLRYFIAYQWQTRVLGKMPNNSKTGSRL